MHLCLRSTKAEGALLRKDVIWVVFTFTILFFSLAIYFTYLYYKKDILTKGKKKLGKYGSTERREVRRKF